MNDLRALSDPLPRAGRIMNMSNPRNFLRALFDQAVAGKPALIELAIDPEALLPTIKLENP